MPLCPPGLAVIGIERATVREIREGVTADLRLADTQALPFLDGRFDPVAALVFCSVPDAARGLTAARRVPAPGGQLLLLDHALSHRTVLRGPRQPASPLVVRIVRANIDRGTIGNLERAGLVVRQATAFLSDIVKLVEAEEPPETGK